jgi:tetratricopeptide (TPR) repeat protein
LRSLAAIILVLWISAFLGRGQVAAPERPVSTVQDFSKEAYVIDKLHTRITAEDDGSGSRELSAEVRILADAGVKAFAVLIFTYTSANEVVDVDYVRVQKPDGTVVKTPEYNIQDMPGEVTRIAPIYGDIHEKHVAVKGLAVGDMLEYLIRYRVVKPQVPGQFWHEYSFIKDAIVKDEHLEIRVPAAKYVKVSSPDFKPQIREEGVQRIYLWDHSNLARPAKDVNEIPLRTPSKPSVQMTTFRDWEEVGSWYANLQKDSSAVTPAIRAKAAELTKGLKTDDEKIRALYNFVSLQFHYIGLDFGIGRYQPHPADDVLGNGYGDCKDKHTLLAALLRASGFDAWPALIHIQRKLDSDVPSPAQFNHVITVIPNADKFIWVDTTPEVAPYQLLVASLRDKQALVMPSTKPPLLMRTPAEPPTPQLQKFTSEGKLSSDGTYTAHVEQVYRGDVEVALRSAFREVSESQWKEVAQRFSYRLGFGGEVDNVTVTPPEQTDKPFSIAYDYVRKSYSGWEERQITPPLPPIGVEASKDTKKTPEAVLLGALGEVVYQAKLTLPPGYSVVAPRSVDLVRPYAEYHATARAEGGVLVSSRRLVVKKDEVAPEDWENYRDFGKAVSEDENTYLHLNGESAGVNGTPPANLQELDDKFREGSEAAAKHDFARAAELLRQVISGNANYRGAHFNLGLVLAGQNKIDEAVVEFRKEQEISSDEVRAYEIPATYFTFMGRRDDAILEWRKLLKVDPKNHTAALQLSGLLAGEGKDADAAVVLESAVKETPDSPALEMALGEAYVRSGQPDQGVPHMRKAMEHNADSQGIDPGTLNDAAYLLAANKTHLDLAKEYGEKAVSSLDKRSVDAADSDEASVPIAAGFAAVWDTLGWVYFQIGETSRAEDFVHAAWILGQQALAGDHLAQIYEKQGKKKEAAHIYEQALSTILTRSISRSTDIRNSPTNYETSRQEIISHYEKLTGKKSPPMIEMRRLPNGEWTKTPDEELTDALRVKVSKKTGLAGVADFSVVFTPGKVESVRYMHGDEEVREMSAALQAAPYQMEFPTGSGAKIVRRVQLTCHPSAGCTAEMLPPSQVMLRKY